MDAHEHNERTIQHNMINNWSLVFSTSQLHKIPLFKTVWDSLAFLCSLKPMLDWKKRSADDLHHHGLQDNWSENALQLWKKTFHQTPRYQELESINLQEKKLRPHHLCSDIQKKTLFCWKQGSQSKYEIVFILQIEFKIISPPLEISNTENFQNGQNAVFAVGFLAGRWLWMDLGTLW